MSENSPGSYQHFYSETQCNLILDMRRVQVLNSRLPGRRGHWKAYQVLVKAKKNSAPELSLISFERLYVAVNCYSLSYQSKVFIADKKAIDVMREFHLPDEYLIQFYAQVRELIAESLTGKKQKAIKEISNPAHYIRRRIGLDPKLDPLELDRLLNDAAEQIVKVKKPTDFLRALKGTDDSSLEIGFARPKFLQRVAPKDTILIVNPAPDFIINWPEVLLDRTTFCMEYEIEVEILKHEFPTVNFLCFDDLFALMDPVDTETANQSDTKTLIFGRGLSSKVQQQLLTTSSILPPDGMISVLTSSVFLDQPTPFRWGAAYFMRGWSISLLPTGVANSEPKRKILRLKISDKQYQNSIVLQAFDWVTDSPAVLEISPQPAVEISQEELTDSAKTLRMLYREKLDTKEKSKRKLPQEYRFTKDIRFWYTISHPNLLASPKVEVYVCKLPTSAQKNRSKQAQGAKIKSAYTSTTIAIIKNSSSS